MCSILRFFIIYVIIFAIFKGGIFMYFDIEYVDNCYTQQFKRVNRRLAKTGELIAFINTYGRLYDKFYYALILNLNNIIEHYLVTGNDKIISYLGVVYDQAKGDNKTEKEIYEILRDEFYRLPVFTINEVEQRRLRRK